jgi:hypothetical protein
VSPDSPLPGKLLGGDFFYDEEGLFFRNPHLTQADLAEIDDALPRLEWLMLSGDEVTDSSIPHLERLTHLKALLLRGTKVTVEGSEKLQRVLPNCKVYVYHDPA